MIPQDPKTYDIKNNHLNEVFLTGLFQMPPTILPLQNLGEIAHIMQKYKEAFTLLDMTIKLYKALDFQNLLKFKALTMLGSLLDSQGDHQSMQRIHETIFKGLEPHTDAYELVFATRNYGYLLAKQD